MEINYTQAAYETLLGIIEYVERKNTKGAGYRWHERYNSFITQRLALHTSIPLCKNHTLHRLEFYCVQYKDWTIAFSKSNNKVLIELLLHKSRLRD